jgi:hypothetical protein
MSKRKAKVSAYDIAEKIAALPCSAEITMYGPKIVEIMRGVPREVFTELDNEGGNAGRRFGEDFINKFYMLRRVRNDATHGFGKQMFAGFV